MAEFTVVNMEAADSTAAAITVGTTVVDITADIMAAGTMAGFTAVLGGLFGGLSMPHRHTTVPMPTGIRIMVIHTMCIHQPPSTDTSLRQHQQPSVTLQRLTKMGG